MPNLPPVSFDVSTPVLVLKLGSYPLHHGGLGVIRSLGRVGVPVYGVHEHPRTPAALSRYLSGRFVWRTEGGDDRDYLLEGMAQLGGRLGAGTIVVPTDDQAAIFLAENAADLERWFVFPRQPAALPRTVADKRGLYLTCRRLGVPCPDAAFPSSWREVREFVDRRGYPVVAKVLRHWTLPPTAGLRSSAIVHGDGQLRDLHRLLGEAAGTHLMLQEYIPRPVAEDWIFHGYCDAGSRCLAGFTGVKLRSYPPHAGPTTLGRCAPNDALRRQAEELFRQLGYRGIMDLDYRLDLRDGRYKLLDFNPRVGAQFRLFENEAGIDVVRALHLDLTGRAVPRAAQVDGRGFVVEHYDLLAAWGYRRDGGPAVRDWLSSLRGATERAWFATDDPVPFLAMSARFLYRLVERTLRTSPVRRRRRPPRFVPARRRGRSRAPGRQGAEPDGPGVANDPGARSGGVRHGRRRRRSA